MGLLTYDPTTNYVRLITLANGDPTLTELLPDGITVSNSSVTQAAIDQAFVDYGNGVIPTIELDSSAENVLTPVLLAQGVMGDPTSLTTISTQLGLTRPTTVVQNVFAPPVVGSGTTPTTVAEAKVNRKAAIQLEFANLMNSGKVIKGFKVNTSLHILQRLRASIDLVVYSGYSDDIAQDADGIWQTIGKRDLSKIMTNGYKHYRDNLDLMFIGLTDVDSTTTITSATNVVVPWKL